MTFFKIPLLVVTIGVAWNPDAPRHPAGILLSVATRSGREPAAGVEWEPKGGRVTFRYWKSLHGIGPEGIALTAVCYFRAGRIRVMRWRYALADAGWYEWGLDTREFALPAPDPHRKSK